MSSERAAFKPEDHFRNLKGQQYLECKWRIVWFREQHPDGYIRTEMIEHEPEGGLAVFKAQAGHWTAEGREVFSTGYGSETRRDFADYLEKAETKAVSRALAMLGYGTAQALELDEGERNLADTPVDRPAASASSRGAAPRPAPRAPLAVVPPSGAAPARTTTVHEPPAGIVREPTEVAERRKLYKLLADDPEAAVKMDATLAAKKTTWDKQDMAYVRKIIAALEDRATNRVIDAPATPDVAEEPDQAVDTSVPPTGVSALQGSMDNWWATVIGKADAWLKSLEERPDRKPYATDIKAAQSILSEQANLLGKELAGAAPQGHQAIVDEIARRWVLMASKLEERQNANQAAEEATPL